jgi:hypothetical protein
MNNIEIPVQLNLHGRYHVQLIDAATHNVKTTLTFENVITNAGLNAIGDGSYTSGLETTGLQFLAVGSGSTTPDITNTTLVNEVTRTSSNGGIASEVGSSASPEYSFLKVTRVFTTAQANANLTELGFVSAGGVLFNRALFKDSLGNPTTIRKTPSDLLQITYELRMTGPQTDVTGTFDYSPIGSSSFTLRPQGINAANQWNNAISRIGVWGYAVNNRVARLSTSTFFNIRTGVNNPSTDGSTTTAPSTITVQSYTNNSFERTVSYVWSTLTGNLASPLSLFVVSPWELTGASDQGRYLYQMLFTPGLPKTTTRKLQINLKYSWNRV